MKTVVTICEHEDSVSVFYDTEWKVTLGCEEAHVGYVHDVILKWATALSRGKIAPSPVWQLILGGIITWYSDEPGEEKVPSHGEDEEEEDAV